MCIVHSTLRDATTPYTERYMQASENANPKKAKSLSDTLLFCHPVSIPTHQPNIGFNLLSLTIIGQVLNWL